MNIRGKSDEREQGFSLIELMMVVLIIAVLIAIAIPAFLGATQRSDDRSTQANVRIAFAASRVYYNDEATYPDPANPAPAMEAVEPSLDWTTDALDGSSSDKAVRIQVYDDPNPRQTVVVVGRTGTGRCFYIKDVMGGASAGTYYEADVTGGATCPEPAPSDIDAGSWSG